MKRFLKKKLNIKPPVDDSITDAMLGTGEQMCTCAALVADIIVEQGQEKTSLKGLMEKVRAEGVAESSTAEKKP